MSTIIDYARKERAAELVGHCAACIDAERYAELESFFADDCSYRVTSYEAWQQGLPIGFMRCTSKGMLIDRINSMRDANIFEPHRYRHLLGTTLVREAGEDRLRTETSFAVIRVMESGDSGLFVSGVYHDTLVEIDGELRIGERVVVLDSSRIDTLIVIPV